MTILGETVRLLALWNDLSCMQLCKASAGQLGKYDAARQAKPVPGRRLSCSSTTPSPGPSSSCADSTGRSCTRQRYDLQRPFPTGVTPHCHAVCSRVNVMSEIDAERATVMWSGTIISLTATPPARRLVPGRRVGARRVSPPPRRGGASPSAVPRPGDTHGVGGQIDGHGRGRPGPSVGTSSIVRCQGSR